MDKDHPIATGDLAVQRRLQDDFQREFLTETRDEAREALRTIIAAYDKVTQDPATKIPTMLMCAIEIGRSKL